MDPGSSSSNSTRIHSRLALPHSSSSKTQSHSYLLMSQTSPIISSALHRSFPILLLLDNFLSFVTWTNDDPYYNFLCICGITSVVFNWLFCMRYLVPLLFAFVFSCLGWSIQSIVRETSSLNEDDVPTLQEILDTLENISTRFEILCGPFKSCVKNLNGRDILKLVVCTVWITPLQIVLITHLFPVERVMGLITIIVLTYYSPWSITTRRLLWRSIYIRQFVYLVTGLKFNLRNESYDQKSFKILSDNKLSPMQNGKIIQFEILENQRRWVAIGWSDYLLPYERTNFTTVSLTECSPPLSFEFTVLHSAHSWKWIENAWSIDYEFNKNKDGGGWVYYDTNWNYPSYYDGLTKYTRTRKWRRKAILIVNE